ncbi:MAG: hypothetical protein K9N52_03135 [Verrucomicrobia bacterium]|nr:hypothetical protein [Verrucomicrobiota bacterium]
MNKKINKQVKAYMTLGIVVSILTVMSVADVVATSCAIDDEDQTSCENPNSECNGWAYYGEDWTGYCRTVASGCKCDENYYPLSDTSD